MTSNLVGSEYYTKYIVIIKINVNTYLYFLAIKPTTIHFVHFCSSKPDLFQRQNPINGVLSLVVLTRASSKWKAQVRALQADLPGVLSAPRKIVVRAPRQQQHRLRDDEVQRIIGAYRDGSDMKQLAREYGVHRSTVAALLRKHSVALRREGISEVVLPEIIRLYVAEGWSCQRLAERFDCDDETVRQALKRAGVQLRKPWERV